MFFSLTPSARVVHEKLRQWFDTPLGSHLLKTEMAVLDQLLPGLFGYNLMQVSIQDQPLFHASSVQTKLRVTLDSRSGDGSCVLARPDNLPFANDSIDVTLLHHLLDFSDSPHDILKEVSRVTLPMGHLVVIGFNPFSLWGAWRHAARFKGGAPWMGRFIRPGRLMDWLNLLDFKIDRAQYAIYGPPFARYQGKVRDYSQGISRNLNLPTGGIYVIVARKHVGSMTSIRPVWRDKQAFGRLGVVRSIPHRSTSHPQETTTQGADSESSSRDIY